MKHRSTMRDAGFIHYAPALSPARERRGGLSLLTQKPARLSLHSNETSLVTLLPQHSLAKYLYRYRVGYNPKNSFSKSVHLIIGFGHKITVFKLTSKTRISIMEKMQFHLFSPDCGTVIKLKSFARTLWQGQTRVTGGFPGGSQHLGALHSFAQGHEHAKLAKSSNDFFSS